MEPMLIDVPERIETERLVLRAPRRRRRPHRQRRDPRLARRARAVAAVGRDDAERRRVGGALPPPAGALHPARGLRLASCSCAAPTAAKASSSAARGLHRIDWTLRKFEIGYWRKTGCEGRGFVTEAVRALARLAFDTLDARRVEIRMDDNNAAQLARRRARRLHARGAAALRLGDAARRAAQHAHLCARARRRGADGRRRSSRRGAPRARRRQSATPSPGEKRSTASVTMPSMPSASSRRASAGSLTV